MKSVEIIKAINSKDVASKAAKEIASSMIRVIATQGVCHIALTGGTVGILTLEMLLRDSSFSNVDLTKVHFWWGDERFVSKSSKDRNSNQANQALLDHIHIPISNIHEFPASDSGLSLFDARERFEEILGAFFAGDEPKMDITILGMGPDGHVASLFPGFTPDGSHVVAVENSPKPPSERLSFGIELINRSAKIIFVVSGLDKAEAVFSVLKNPACEFPAAQVRASGETIWFIDEAAGSEFWGC